MKKTLVLVLTLVMFLLPSQAFAAQGVTTSTIEKTYFEDYKDRVKEVRTALNSLKPTSCPNVIKLTEKSKASVNTYNKAVKSKASKDAIAKAKAARDADKKALNAAKSKCSKSVQNVKKETNKTLKKIDIEKSSLIKEIKDNWGSYDDDPEKYDEFEQSMNKRLDAIDQAFTSLVKGIRSKL